MRSLPELSHGLNLNQIDDVVDELRKGKYSKCRPSFVQLLSTGLFRAGPRKDYVDQRWKDLTGAGLTMRRNKLSKLFTEAVGDLNSQLSQVRKLPNAIWKFEQSNYSQWKAPPLFIFGEYESSKNIYNVMLKPFAEDISKRDDSSLRFYCLGDKEKIEELNQTFSKEIDFKIKEIDQIIKEGERKKVLYDSLRLSMDHAMMIMK